MFGYRRVTKLVTSLLVLGVTLVALQFVNLRTFVKKKPSYRQEPDFIQDQDDYDEKKADPFDFERHFKVCSAKRSSLHSSDLIRKVYYMTLP